jgi:Kef-type K+ transport system membrane component KefB
MSFALLALICAVAILGPLLSLGKMLRVPVVIGELAVGVVFGSTGFGLLDAKDPTLEFLAQIGFALVMFVAGSHVPIRQPAMVGGLGRGALRAVVPRRVV